MILRRYCQNERTNKMIWIILYVIIMAFILLCLRTFRRFDDEYYKMLDQENERFKEILDILDK